MPSMTAEQARIRDYWANTHMVENVAYAGYLWTATINRDADGDDSAPVNLARRCPGCWTLVDGAARSNRPHRETTTVTLGELKQHLAELTARRSRLAAAGIATGWVDGKYTVR